MEVTVRKGRMLVAVLTTVFAASSIQAIANTRAGGKSGVEASVELTAGKKKSKKKGAKKASRKSKAANVANFKSCGTFMYRKDGKCVDARAKK